MTVGKTLTSIVFSLSILTQVALAQQKDWAKIIYNCHIKEETRDTIMHLYPKETTEFKEENKRDTLIHLVKNDTILYRDATWEYSLVNDKGTYKIFKTESFGQFKPEQCSTPWNNNIVEKALRIKNTVLKYKSLEEAMMTISCTNSKEEDRFRLLKYYVKEYFDAVAEYFPKSEERIGQLVKGDEREYYIKCQKAAQADLKNAKFNKQSTEGLDYLIKYLDDRLGVVKKVTDEESGKILLSKDKNGKEIYVVIAEYPPSIYGEFADRNALPILKTKEVLINYAQPIIHKKITKFIGGTLWEGSKTKDGKYKVAVIYWQIGNGKQDRQIKETIKDTINLIEIK